MDCWELYTAGKISKPTQSSQLLRLEAHGDFVIEWPDNHPPEKNELTDLPGARESVDSIATEDTLGVRCSELDRAGLISCTSQAVNLRREKLWHESCRPGTPPLGTLQAVVCGFALAFIAALASVVFSQ